MRDEDGRPRWWNVAGQLLAAYTIGGALLAWPLMSTIWPRDFPDLRPYLATALAVSCVLTIAVFMRARRLASGAAVLIPLVVAAAWHAIEIRWNPDLQGLAAAGDPAAIAMVLRGRQGGWLWAIGPATVTGALAALLYALFCMWKLDRADDHAP